MNTLSLAPAAIPATRIWPVKAFPLRLAAPGNPGQPLSFTMQVGPGLYLQQRLPRGLDGQGIVSYVQAFARTRNHDCCIEYPGGKTLYLLSDGGRFEAED